MQMTATALAIALIGSTAIGAGATYLTAQAKVSLTCPSENLAGTGIPLGNPPPMTGQKAY
jgi:hypothetical protein